MDRHTASEFGMDLPYEINQCRIHLRWLIAPPITQVPIELSKSSRHVAAIALVDDAQCFLGVDIVERNRALTIGAKR